MLKKLLRMTLMPLKSLLKTRKVKQRKLKPRLTTRTKKRKTQNLTNRSKRTKIKTKAKMSLKKNQLTVTSRTSKQRSQVSRNLKLTRSQKSKRAQRSKMKVNPTRSKQTVTLKTRRRLRVSKNHCLKQKVRNQKVLYNKKKKIKMNSKTIPMMNMLIAMDRASSMTKRARARVRISKN